MMTRISMILKRRTFKNLKCLVILSLEIVAHSPLRMHVLGIARICLYLFRRRLICTSTVLTSPQILIPL